MPHFCIHLCLHMSAKDNPSHKGSSIKITHPNRTCICLVISCMSRKENRKARSSQMVKQSLNLDNYQHKCHSHDTDSAKNTSNILWRLCRYSMAHCKVNTTLMMNQRMYQKGIDCSKLVNLHWQTAIVLGSYIWCTEIECNCKLCMEPRNLNK